MKYKNEDKDKMTGNYQRYTTTEASQTSTVKVGNKSGYTEYYKHERVCEVDFGPSY
ncbi:hypothetical protein LguiB_002223 [Lonicera macranthoides]